MTAPKKTAGKKPVAKPKARVEHNALVEASNEAQRGLLLATLKASDWSLTRTAEALRLHGPSAVIRYLNALGLGPEYEAARTRGDVKQGRPKD